MPTSSKRERVIARQRYERRLAREAQRRAARRRRTTVIGAVVATLAVVGGIIALAVTLGSGSTNKQTTAASPSASASPSPSPSPIPGKPTVVVPAGKPPTTLVVKDLKKGTGAVATKGRSVTVNYVGVAWSTGKQFDASYDRGQPFTFTLGAGQVIKGWDQGVAGMRVGGRRELIIPPSLGYGAQGAGSAIKPNETLIFVVDLVAVK